MEFQGTKGKWHIMKGGLAHKDTPNLIQIYATNDNLELVCKVEKDRVLHDCNQDFEANAKLIASAPEMFELLKKIRDEKVSEHYFKIEKLLTKITK